MAATILLLVAILTVATLFSVLWVRVERRR